MGELWIVGEITFTRLEKSCLPLTVHISIDQEYILHWLWFSMKPNIGKPKKYFLGKIHKINKPWMIFCMMHNLKIDPLSSASNSHYWFKSMSPKRTKRQIKYYVLYNTNTKSLFHLFKLLRKNMAYFHYLVISSDVSASHWSTQNLYLSVEMKRKSWGSPCTNAKRERVSKELIFQKDKNVNYK